MREKHKPLRVACYMRVAQAESAEAAQLAMAGQKAVLGDVAEKCGNIVTAYFQDYMNGIQYQRPGLLSVLDAIKCGQAVALLVKDEGRLGRDAIKNRAIKEQLQQAGGRIIFADELQTYHKEVD